MNCLYNSHILLFMLVKLHTEKYYASKQHVIKTLAL